jgi:hypothetical protein
MINNRDELIKMYKKTSTLPTGVYGTTPLFLVEEIVDQISNEIDWSNPKLKIIDPFFGLGGFLFVVYLKLRQHHSHEHIVNNMLYGVETEVFRYKLMQKRLGIKNIYHRDFLTWESSMQFDLVLGNPPYQELKEGNRKSKAIWPDFVHKAISICKPGGYVSLIHPSGWRNVDGNYVDIKSILLSKKMTYLEMHNKQDGIQTFGARTPYDWYVVQNIEVANNITKVKQQDGVVVDVDLNTLPMIPMGHIEELQKLTAEVDEPTVEVLHSWSAYETRNKYMSRKKTKSYKYPCVYCVRANPRDELDLWYSSEQKGHFGIPKLIWGDGGYNMGSYADMTGEYGLTQFAYGLVDTPENLPHIKKAFDSKEFRTIMASFDGGNGSINRKVIAKFKKDWWKHFV